MQLAALAVTLVIAIVGGTITGFILKGYYNILNLIFVRQRVMKKTLAQTLFFKRKICSIALNSFA